jgi:hypothetical protein
MPILAAALLALLQSAPQKPALVTCLAAAGDSTPIYPTDEFPGSLRKIVVAYRLADSESFERLTSIWIAVDVGDAAPANTEMARVDIALQGHKRGTIKYSQDNPLPIGKYRVDVLADGKPWKSVAFTVVPATAIAPLANPADLFALTEGKIWNYEFTQQSGTGEKLTVPGVETDADGRLRAKVAIVVGKSDKDGTRLEFRRNGQLVQEEWWRLEAAGLAVTQRKGSGEAVRLDPPQLLLALPLAAEKRWDYRPKDGAYQQTYRMVGPLPIALARAGLTSKPTMGFVVIVEQAMDANNPPAGKITVERHFVPGVGLVKETILTTMGDKLVGRQEMTLQ